MASSPLGKGSGGAVSIPPWHPRHSTWFRSWTLPCQSSRQKEEGESGKEGPPAHVSLFRPVEDRQAKEDEPCQIDRKHAQERGRQVQRFGKALEEGKENIEVVIEILQELIDGKEVPL